MAFSSGSFAEAAAGNRLYTEINSVLIAAGWGLVDTLTRSGDNYTHVYKSAGTGNEAGYDWFLAVLHTGTGSENPVSVVVGAGYDSVGKNILGLARRNGGDNQATTGYYNAPVSVNQTIPNSPSYDLAGVFNAFRCSPPSSTVYYWIAATRDAVSINVDFTVQVGGSGRWMVASTLDIDPGWSDPSIYTPTGVSSNLVAMSSELFRGSSQPGDGYVGLSGSVIGPVVGSVVGTLPTFGRHITDAGTPLIPTYATRPALMFGQTVTPAPRPASDYTTSLYAKSIGTMRGVYAVPCNGTFGDTCTIGGVVHKLTRPIVTGPSIYVSFAIPAV